MVLGNYVSDVNTKASKLRTMTDPLLAKGSCPADISILEDITIKL